MTIHLPTLVLAAAALMLLAAAALALIGFTQHVYRGFTWWVGAMGSVTIALWLLMFADGNRLAELAAHVLLLAWPCLNLAGLRRFHARLPMPGSRSGDAAAFALAALLLCGLSADPTLGVVTFAAASAALHAYAAAVLWWGRARRDSVALNVAAGAWLASAVALGAAAWWVSRVTLTDAAPAVGLLLVPGALVMFVLALQLTHERTERELRESRRRLRFLANIDMLTRVPNRRHFGDLARRTLERDSAPAAMLMFDIDHFKRINDVLGHAAGDRALRLVARCVQETLRTHDVAGRHGGDEFVLLLPHTSVLDAMVVASRIVERVQTHADQHDTPPLSLSFGVVQTLPGESVDDALHRADQALYEAKRQGRSRAVVSDGASSFTESRRLGLNTL